MFKKTIESISLGYRRHINITILGNQKDSILSPSNLKDKPCFERKLVKKQCGIPHNQGFNFVLFVYMFIL